MKFKNRLPILLSAPFLLLCPLAQADHPYLFLEYVNADSCMQCHWSPMGSTRAVNLEEIMQSSHWTWEKEEFDTGLTTGKRHVINNYCVAVPSNEPRCTSCHIGVGWKDDSFDFSDSSQIDCLICHDGSGTYRKIPTGAGSPVAGLDYKEIFRNLQKPDRHNCGVCHFYGGGGDAVKHGDLDSSMANPSRSLDVHMGSIESGGLNMDCIDCHLAEGGGHLITGTRYSKPHNDAAGCIQCHEDMLAPGTRIHEGRFMLDEHTAKVACQSCHIPAFARGGLKTKTFWDWSTAGQFTEDGQKIATESYNTMKGSFEWEANVAPDYMWSNGKARYVTLDDTFMQGQLVIINDLEGNRRDPRSLIFPVKRFTAVQPYDPVIGNLVIPNLFPNPSPAEDPGAYWKSYDWIQAATGGMAAVNRPFSGQVDWISSEMYWIQNHMVAPKEDALRCIDCHSTYGQMDFNALGYRGAEADVLQRLYQYAVWAGFEVDDEAWADTGDWLGRLYLWDAPWVFVMDLDRYLYIPESGVYPYGGWVYMPAASGFSSWTPAGQDWFYAPVFSKYVFFPNPGEAAGGWVFIPNW